MIPRNFRKLQVHSLFKRFTWQTSLKLGFAGAGTTKFRLEMLTLYPIGSVISTLAVMISAHNMYQTKTNYL